MLEAFTWLYIVMLGLGAVMNVLMLIDSDDATTGQRVEHFVRIIIMVGGILLLLNWLY